MYLAVHLLVSFACLVGLHRCWATTRRLRSPCTRSRKPLPPKRVSQRQTQTLLHDQSTNVAIYHGRKEYLCFAVPFAAVIANSSQSGADRGHPFSLGWHENTPCHSAPRGDHSSLLANQSSVTSCCSLVIMIVHHSSFVIHQTPFVGQRTVQHKFLFRLLLLRAWWKKRCHFCLRRAAARSSCCERPIRSRPPLFFLVYIDPKTVINYAHDGVSRPLNMRFSSVLPR